MDFFGTHAFSLFVSQNVISRSGACLSGAARTKFMGVERWTKTRKRERERWKEERLIFIGTVVEISRESALVTSRDTVGVLRRSRESLFDVVISPRDEKKSRIFLCETKQLWRVGVETIFKFFSHKSQ